MKRIDSRTVELLPGEINLRNEFEEALSEGYSIQEAALKVLPTFGKRYSQVHAEHSDAPRWISDEFVDYLSDGTVRLDGARRYRTVNLPATAPVGDPS